MRGCTFPWVDATDPYLCMWLHSSWRFAESWQMDGRTSSSPPSWLIFCPHILSAQDLSCLEIPHYTRYLTKWFAMQKLKMLRIRRETSGRSETLGRAVVPRLRTTAWTGSTRHGGYCCSLQSDLHQTDPRAKRAASEADVAGFKRRMGDDAMQACMDPSVCPQYDLQYQECNCFTSGTSEDGVRYVTCVLERERKDFEHI